MTIKVKKLLNLYNLAILVCIILISISLYILFKPESKTTRMGARNCKFWNKRK